MQFEIKHIFNIIIIFQLVSFSIFIIFRENCNRTNRYILSALLLSIAMIFLGYVFNHYLEWIYNHIPHLFYINFPFFLLYPPLLFLYTKSLTERNNTIGKKQLLHFIPPVLALLFILFRYHLHSTETLRILLESGSNDNPILNSFEQYIFFLFRYLQFFVYAIASLLIVKRYQAAAKNLFSSDDQVHLLWVKIVILGLVLWNIINILTGIEWIVWRNALFISSRIVMLILITVLVFRGLRQPEISIDFNNVNHRKKYEKSHLSASDCVLYKQTLLDFMESEKPYLNSSVDLQSLAHSLSIKPHHLSQVFNEILHQNFYDFINSYRIKESQSFLADQTHQEATILEILYQIGFNSKSVFNSAFKKHTGMTPTEYRKSLNNIQKSKK